MDATSTQPSHDACDPVEVNDLQVRPGFTTMLRLNELDSIDALFAVRSDTPLGKPGLDPWRERLRVTLHDGTVKDGPTERVFYIKRYQNPPARAVREASCAGASSIAGIEWRWIDRLRRDGIPSVEAVALGEEFDGSRETRSVLVTAAVPGESLETLVPAWHLDKRRDLRRLISPLAKLVSRLHGKGYVHRDLYLCHVFFVESGEADHSLRLIDLQRMRRPRWNMSRWVVKDLASLNYSAPEDAVSTTDRVRWLKEYLGKSCLDAEARRLIYRIVGKTRRIARHDARRRERFHRDDAEGSGASR